MFAAQGQRFPPRLDHTGFVVCCHDRNQSGPLVLQFAGQPVEVHHAAARDGNEPQPRGEIVPRRFQNAGMFHR